MQPDASDPGARPAGGASPRFATLDAVRGVAVMGILLLNIVSFAMPGYAYVDPHFYGGASGANWWAWALAYVLADGKMRGLFTMMFGASTVLIAERAAAGGESPARVHYARMATLLGFGMVHAYLIWSGDILVLYAVVGAVAFLAWRWPPKVLLLVGVALMAWTLVGGLLGYASVRDLEARVAAHRASPAERAGWQRFVETSRPPPDYRARELAAFTGSFAEAQSRRAENAFFVQTALEVPMIPDTLGLMLFGMALFGWGFFSGTWPRRAYAGLVALGVLVALPLYWPLVTLIDRSRFDPLTLMLSDTLHLALLRPWLSLAWAAATILLVRSGRAAWLTTRLSATGRMAFSNYLGTSIVCTLFFYGYGLGFFGRLERWQCYLVVAAVWALMLLWSKPWLDRFAYGPFEWLWRSAARGHWQPMRRRRATG